MTTKTQGAPKVSMPWPPNEHSKRGWEIAIETRFEPARAVQIRTIPAEINNFGKSGSTHICCGRLGPLCLSVRDGPLRIRFKMFKPCNFRLGRGDRPVLRLGAIVADMIFHLDFD
jgi:hypothetical protein